MPPVTRAQTRAAAAGSAASQQFVPNADNLQQFPDIGELDPGQPNVSATVEEVDGDHTMDAAQGPVVPWSPTNAAVAQFVADAGNSARRIAERTANQAEVVHFMTELARFAPHIMSVGDIGHVRDDILQVVHTALTVEFQAEHANQQVFADEVGRTLNEQGALILRAMQDAATAAHRSDAQDNILLEMVNHLDAVGSQRSDHAQCMVDLLARRQANDASNLRQLVVDRANLINNTVENALAEVASVRRDASAAVQWQNANFDARLNSQRDSFAVLLQDAEERSVQLGRSAADAAATRAAALAISTATAASRADAGAAREHADSQLTAFAASNAAERQGESAMVRAELHRVSADNMSRALEIAAMASRAVCAESEGRLYAARVEGDARNTAAHLAQRAHTTRELTKTRADNVADLIATRAAFAQMQQETFTDAVEQTTATIKTTSAAHIKANDAVAKSVRTITMDVTSLTTDMDAMRNDIKLLQSTIDDKPDKCCALARRITGAEQRLANLDSAVRALQNGAKDKSRDFQDLADAVQVLSDLVNARLREFESAGARPYLGFARVSQSPDRGGDGAAEAAPRPTRRVTTTWAPGPVSQAELPPVPDDGSDDPDVEAYNPHGPQNSAPTRNATAQFFSHVHAEHRAQVPCGNGPPGFAAASPKPRPPPSAPQQQPSSQAQYAPQHGGHAPAPIQPQHPGPLPVHHLAWQPHQQHAQSQRFATYPSQLQPAYVQHAMKPDVQVLSVVAETPPEMAKYLNRVRALELRDAIGAGITNLPNVSQHDERTVTGFLLLSVGVFHGRPREWGKRFEETFLETIGSQITSSALARLTNGFSYLCGQVAHSLVPGLTPDALWSTAEHFDVVTRTPLGLAPVFDENNPAVCLATDTFHELRREVTELLFGQLAIIGVGASKLNTLHDGAIAKARLNPPTSAKAFNPVVEARTLRSARGGSAGGGYSGNTPPAAPRLPSSGKRHSKQPAAASAPASSQPKASQQPAQSAQPARAGTGPGGGQQ